MIMPANKSMLDWMYLSFLLLSTHHTLAVNAAEFDSEIQLTESIEGIEFSRNPQNAMHVTSGGVVHLVYTQPDWSKPVPNTSIYYQTIQNGFPSIPEQINSNSTHAQHPSMKISEDGTVYVAWHDSRHSTSAGNWIDNLEIYFDIKHPGASFLDEDIRITQTSASHNGDNGYAPQMAIQQDGKVVITWYDFHSDGSHADVYLRWSTLDGSFQAVNGINQFQLTHVDNHAANASNWLPTLTRFGSGMYLVWGVQEGFTQLLNMRGLMVHENETVMEEEALWVGSKFLDPTRLATDVNGNMGCVYTTIMNNLNHVMFRRRNINETWSESLILNQSGLHSTQPHLAYDTKGNAHIVWQEDLGGIFEIHYASVEPKTMSVLFEKTVSSLDADARTPVIALQPGTDRVTIAWIDRRNTPLSAVYMIQETGTAVYHWQQYE